MRLRRKLPLVPLAALLVFAGVALAFQEVPEVTRLEVSRAGWQDEGLWIGPTSEAGLAKASPLGGFAARYGGEWSYNRNTLTGSLHRVYGSGFPFAGTIGDADAAERSARDFIGANEALFRATNADLRRAEMQNGAGKWVAHFDQVVDGVRVVGGRVNVVFMENGRLFAFGSDVYPDVDVNVTPTLSRAEALSIAATDIGFVDGTDEITYEELVILPTRDASGEMLSLNYHLAYRFDLFAQNPYGHWETYVDATSGEILWRRSLIHSVDFTGQVAGDVEWMGYCDGVTTGYGLEQMRLPISGVGTAESDVDGYFSLTYGGTDARTITSNFIGTFFNIDRYTGTNASYSSSITPGTPLTINWTNANSIASERDCWAYLNMQHRFMKALDPTFTGLDYQMPVSVERTDGYCPGNAWYDYYGVNFCVQSTSYGNTGRMGDVAWHEYGHGITDQVYGPNDPGSGLHEGNSDVASLIFTREPRLGLGFYLNNCTSGIRNAENTMQYPQDWSETHTGGQIISGFFWDSWQELMTAYPWSYADSVIAYDWHFGRKLGLPQSPPDQVYWTFVADDNDGNLDNGTPNHAAFCVGATNHGFDCPEILGPVHIVHTPVESQPSTVSPTAITATITSDAASIDAGACAVHYRVDGGSFADVGMSGVGGDDYTGYIPAQGAGAFVEYYVYGQDVLGNSATDPTGAPIGLHSFYVGEFSVVYESDFEASITGWTIGDTGDDATTGLWEWGDPQGTTSGQQCQPEDDHTSAPGVKCWATGLLAGTSAGSYDIDNGKTTIISPVFDLSGASLAIVSYWRWYTNDLGNAPGSDYWVVQVNTGSGWTNLENTLVSDNSWTKHQFAITPSATVQFKFIASDEGTGSLVEAAVDDFKLEAILPPSVDATLSTVSSNNNLMLAPDGNGDSTMTIVVTAKDSNGDPVVGIPAGDVAVTLSGVSALGESMIFCASGTDVATFYSTAPTDAYGQTTILVDHVGGCGTVGMTCLIQTVSLAAGASATVHSPDFTGDGVVNFFDTFQYLPILLAGTGECGNLNNSPDGVVNFFDTAKYLPFLAGNAQCP